MTGHFHVTFGTVGCLSDGELIAADATGALNELADFLEEWSALTPDDNDARSARELATDCRGDGAALRTLTSQGALTTGVGTRVYEVFRCEATDCDGEDL